MEVDWTAVFGFVRGALQSNLFGLACPFYCHPASLPVILLSFLLGTLAGSLLTVGFCLRFQVSFAGAQSAQTAGHRVNPRLAAYVHARH